MIFIYGLTFFLLFISFIKDRKKTICALKTAWKKLLKILPSFLMMIIAVSIIFFFVSEELIYKYLNESSKWSSALSAIFIGSISVIPGFIAFPFGGILIKQGVSHMVVSAFTTTLMMIGVVTFPIEKLYLGTKVAILRNAISLVIAILTALVTALFYGELL